MALPDPLAVPVGLLNATPASSWPRLSDGEYILSTSDSDQPQVITIQRTLDPSKVSSYVVKTTHAKNVTTPASGIAVADDVLQVHTVIKLPHRSFTLVEATRLLDINTTAFKQYMDRIIRGER
jgi:hypothetical protein